MSETQPLLTQLDIIFDDLNLLHLALTHRSFVNEQTEETEDNERLEFLGDAVLDFVVGSYLYRNFPEMNEGEMTALRAALVRAETLAEFARMLEIGRFLRLGLGEEENGGRDKTQTLCAAFESVIGAIYLDQGVSATIPLIERLIKPKLETIRAQSLHIDAKSEFQMWAQAERGITPHYEVISEAGPDHAKTFTMQVLLEDEAWGQGAGSSKRRAAQAAALDALTTVALVNEA